MDEINKGGLFMKTVVDKANTRGYANHGWLKTHHTFSFANYYNRSSAIHDLHTREYWLYPLLFS